MRRGRESWFWNRPARQLLRRQLPHILGGAAAAEATSTYTLTTSQMLSARAAISAKTVALYCLRCVSSRGPGRLLPRAGPPNAAYSCD